MPPAAGDPEYLVVGHVAKPHGMKGEVFVSPLTEQPDAVYAPGTRLHFADAEGSTPDPGLPEARIAEVRAYRRGFLVRFDGTRDRDGADLLRDRYLLRPFEEVEPPGEGELFYHQLLGMSVVTRAGEDVGTIREVYALRPAALLDVHGSDGECLIPFTREIVVGWDLGAGKLTIDPLPGLLDL